MTPDLVETVNLVAIVISTGSNWIQRSPIPRKHRICRRGILIRRVGIRSYGRGKADDTL